MKKEWMKVIDDQRKELWKEHAALKKKNPNNIFERVPVLAAIDMLDTIKEKLNNQTIKSGRKD